MTLNILMLYVQGIWEKRRMSTLFVVWLQVKYWKNFLFFLMSHIEVNGLMDAFLE